MGLFERYLSLWVALAIALGVTWGSLAPETFTAIAGFEVAGINGVVALLIWLMITPMMLKVDPRALTRVGRRPKGLVLTLMVNWLIKPFTMAALGVLFFRGFFSDLVSVEEADQYIAGLILLGVAPCTAMVFVWSHLTEGDANLRTHRQCVRGNVLWTIQENLKYLGLGRFIVADLMVHDPGYGWGYKPVEESMGPAEL